MKKERVIKSTVDTSAKTLLITVVGHNDILVDLDKIHADMITHASLHGLKQKICDSAALGQGYSTKEKYEAMVETFNRITSAEPSWNKRPEGGASVTGLLYRALCRLYPEKDSGKLKDYHDGLTKSEQYALRQNAKIASIIEVIKAESVSTVGIDSDELLEGLEGI